MLPTLAGSVAIAIVAAQVYYRVITGEFIRASAELTAITLVSGVILIVMGVLLFTNELTQLNAEALRVMDDLNLNFFSEI